MHPLQHRTARPDRTYAWIADKDGTELARLTIDHRRMVISGEVTAQIAAVGNVFTAVEARGQGLARRLMDAVADLAPAADLAVLFGIDGYYLDQGYVRAGDEWLYTFPLRDDATRSSARIDPNLSTAMLADGWLVAHDQRAGEVETAPTQELLPGTIIRTEMDWAMMSGKVASASPGTDRAGWLTTFLSPNSEFAATLWTDNAHGVCAELRRSLPPNSVFVPEILAENTEGALMIIAHMAASNPTATSVVVAAHPHSVVASLAEQLDAQVLRTTRPYGGLMARVLPGAAANVQAAIQEAGPTLWIPLPDRW